MPSPTKDQQCRVSRWAKRTFGVRVYLDKQERALRVMEEAIELAQAVGLSREHGERLLTQVYAKRHGDPVDEIAQVVLTTYLAADAFGRRATCLAETELRRIELLPLQYFQVRQIGKVHP